MTATECSPRRKRVVRSTHPDLAIRTTTVKGAVATALKGRLAIGPALLVVGTGAADHRALGGHVVRTVHRTHCPVLVWRPSIAKRTGKPLPVVVGVDDSERLAARSRKHSTSPACCMRS